MGQSILEKMPDSFIESLWQEDETFSDVVACFGRWLEKLLPRYCLSLKKQIRKLDRDLNSPGLTVLDRAQLMRQRYRLYQKESIKAVKLPNFDIRRYPWFTQEMSQKTGISQFDIEKLLSISKRLTVAERKAIRGTHLENSLEQIYKICLGPSAHRYKRIQEEIHRIDPEEIPKNGDTVWIKIAQSERCFQCVIEKTKDHIIFSAWEQIKDHTEINGALGRIGSTIPMELAGQSKEIRNAVKELDAQRAYIVLIGVYPFLKHGIRRNGFILVDRNQEENHRFVEKVTGK